MKYPIFFLLVFVCIHKSFAQNRVISGNTAELKSNGVLKKNKSVFNVVYHFDGKSSPNFYKSLKNNPHLESVTLVQPSQGDIDFLLNDFQSSSLLKVYIQEFGHENLSISLVKPIEVLHIEGNTVLQNVKFIEGEKCAVKDLKIHGLNIKSIDNPQFLDALERIDLQCNIEKHPFSCKKMKVARMALSKPDGGLNDFCGCSTIDTLYVSKANFNVPIEYCMKYMMYQGTIVLLNGVNQNEEINIPSMESPVVPPAPINMAPPVASENDVVEIPQIEASFPGGEQARDKFVKSNLNYPSEAVANGEMGKVYVRFIVERDGTISNVSISRGVSPSLNNEAMRIVQLMPAWSPAYNRGKPVRSNVVIPVLFRLN